MGQIAGQVELLGQVHGLGRIERRVDVVKAQHLLVGGDEEGAILHGEAIGQGQALGDGLDLLLAEGIGDRIDAPEGAGGDEERALGRQQHHARARHTRGEDLDLEALGHLDLVHGQLVAGRGDGRHGMAAQVDVLLAALSLFAHEVGDGRRRGWRRRLGEGRAADGGDRQGRDQAAQARLGNETRLHDGRSPLRALFGALANCKLK